MIRFTNWINTVYSTHDPIQDIFKILAEQKKTFVPGNSPKPSPYVKLSVIGRPDKKSNIRMFTKNPIFRQCFALPIGNPESDDLYINVYDSGPEQDHNAQKNIGDLKIIVSRLLRRSNVS